MTLPILRRCQEGINKGFKPKLVKDGVNGSYFLRDSLGNQVAIFKAIDEEPFAPNNPKGYVSFFGEPSFRSGIRSGEVCLRELAAFYLDDQKIHSVPRTSLVQIKSKYFINNF